MLEQKIEALTAAIVANTEALLARQRVEVLQPAPGEPLEIPIATARKVAGLLAPAKEGKPAVAKAPEPTAAKALEYDDVKKPFVAFIESKGHEAAAAVLADFGVSKLPALPPERFGEMLAALEKWA